MHDLKAGQGRRLPNSLLRQALAVVIAAAVSAAVGAPAFAQADPPPPPAAQAPANATPDAGHAIVPAVGAAAPVEETPPTSANPVAAAPDASPPQSPATPPPSPGLQALGTLPTDLSPWSMFLHADIIVKAVMAGLAFASFITWTVWLAKGVELVAAKWRARSAMRKLERADSLAEAINEIGGAWTRQGPVADLVQAALRETARSSGLSTEGVKERLAIALSRIEARAGRSMAKGTGLLATIGATAPFVGLFGTVWGIMNSFIGISQSHTTNLAVVAPGIAEALLATAIGLVAAIPAVIIYNVFARSIAGYRAVLSDASGEVLQHISRDLERQQRGLGAEPDSDRTRVREPVRQAAGSGRLRPAE